MAAAALKLGGKLGGKFAKSGSRKLARRGRRRMRDVDFDDFDDFDDDDDDYESSGTSFFSFKRIIMSLNPISPLNWIIIAILGVLYWFFLKRVLNIFLEPILKDKKFCLKQPDEFCMNLERARYIAMFLLYLIVQILVMKVMCLILPYIPPPVGLLAMLIC